MNFSTSASGLPGETGQAKALGSAIVLLVERIDAVLDEERKALSHGGGGGDIDTIVSRKSHLAIELMRIATHVNIAELDEKVRVRLSTLSRNLTQNARLLQRHVDAVRSVSDIIALAICQSSDDGTYSSTGPRRGGHSW